MQIRGGMWYDSLGRPIGTYSESVRLPKSGIQSYVRIEDFYPSRMNARYTSRDSDLVTPFGVAYLDFYIYSHDKFNGYIYDSTKGHEYFEKLYRKKIYSALEKSLQRGIEDGKIVVSIPTVDKMLTELGEGIPEIRRNMSLVLKKPISDSEFCRIKDAVLVHQYMMCIDTVYFLYINHDDVKFDMFCAIPEVLHYHFRRSVYAPNCIDKMLGINSDDKLLCSSISFSNKTIDGRDFIKKPVMANIDWNGYLAFNPWSGAESKECQLMRKGILSGTSKEQSIVSYRYTVELMKMLVYVLRERGGLGRVSYVDLSRGFVKKSVKTVSVDLKQTRVYRGAYCYHKIEFANADGGNVSIDIFCLLSIEFK